MIFTKKEKIPKLDSFDRLKEITLALLLFECPEHRSQHHILFTLNTKKHRLLENMEKLQTMQPHLHTIQQLTLETRQHILTTIQQWSHLETLYLLTLEETKRQSINHALTFKEQHLADLYSFFSNEKELFLSLDRKKEFYEAIKQELFQLTNQLSL